MTVWELMIKYNLPCPGSRVIFTKTPGGSYAETGEVYHVSWSYGRWSTNLVSLTRISPEPRCGTYDSMMAWAHAEWEYDYSTVEKPHLRWPRP